MLFSKPIIFLALLGAALVNCCLGCASGEGSNSTPGSTPDPDNTGNPNAPATPQTYVWNAADFDRVYDVGPGQTYVDPSEVPWEDLEPSTLVRIHYRDQPYRTKFVVTTRATQEAPLVIMGVPGNGRLPVISGDNAVTRSSLYYLNQGRSVVKIGNYTGSGDGDRPAHVYIQDLDIQSGRPGYAFIDHNGESQTYSNNAAAVHVEEGDHISIVGCSLHDCGNGLFSSHLTSDLLIRQNHIYDNGIEDRYYEHNSYTESRGIVFEYNHYGPLRSGCQGNNLKDRSSGTVIRYNWIEGGNRQLDLVETDHDAIYNDPAYDETFVYGNLLIEPANAGNSQILHYGGDGANVTMYRQGTLYFYHNTVISTRSGNTTLMRLSTNLVDARLHNNIMLTTAGGQYLAITSGSGQSVLQNNWLPTGWTDTHEASLDSGASVSDLGNLEGLQPGFADLDGQDFGLVADSEAHDSGGNLPLATADYPVQNQYLRHQDGQERPSDGAPDVGAYER